MRKKILNFYAVMNMSIKTKSTAWYKMRSKQKKDIKGERQTCTWSMCSACTDHQAVMSQN